MRTRTIGAYSADHCPLLKTRSLLCEAPASTRLVANPRAGKSWAILGYHWLSLGHRGLSDLRTRSLSSHLIRKFGRTSWKSGNAATYDMLNTYNATGTIYNAPWLRIFFSVAYDVPKYTATRNNKLFVVSFLAKSLVISRRRTFRIAVPYVNAALVL